MRIIKANKITEVVATLCQATNYYLGEDVISALSQAIDNEESPLGRDILRQMLDNIEIAREESCPICQDTGFLVVFLEIGQEINITGGDLYKAIEKGVRKGYKEGYLRKSIVADPIRRNNTGDNTPPVIHTDIVPGDKLKLIIVPKGGGSENMSRLKMLNPAQGIGGIEEFVVETVREAGSNPCPPTIVGVGIGGTFEKAAILAKRGCLRTLGVHNNDPYWAEIEDRLLDKINDLGIGPQGLGGRITSLAVNIEVFPCHIASLPVAVNINCYANRHKEVII